jgi:hypothetical protein
MATVEIGGNTYPVREHLKTAGAKWQSASKTWAMDEDKWVSLKLAKPNLLAGVYPVGGAVTLALGKVNAAPTLARSGAVRYRAVGPCRKCHSYCYGDCEA